MENAHKIGNWHTNSMVDWMVRSNLANSSGPDRAIVTDNRALATNSPYAYSPADWLN